MLPYFINNNVAIFLLVALFLSVNLFAQEQPTTKKQNKSKVKSEVKTKTQHGKGFVDADGDGYNDNAPDHDGDGIPNLAEYAQGTDPCSFTPPMIPIRNGAGLSFTFTRPSAITDVTCIAESWDGNGEWTPALLELVTDGTIQTWRARDPLTSGNPNTRFLRLRFIRD